MGAIPSINSNQDDLNRQLCFGATFVTEDQFRSLLNT